MDLLKEELKCLVLILQVSYVALAERANNAKARAEGYLARVEEALSRDQSDDFWG